jgi:hypothetical protein
MLTSQYCRKVGTNKDTTRIYNKHSICINTTLTNCNKTEQINRPMNCGL